MRCQFCWNRLTRLSFMKTSVLLFALFNFRQCYLTQYSLLERQNNRSSLRLMLLNKKKQQKNLDYLIQYKKIINTYFSWIYSNFYQFLQKVPDNVQLNILFNSIILKTCFKVFKIADVVLQNKSISYELWIMSTWSESVNIIIY